METAANNPLDLLVVSPDQKSVFLSPSGVQQLNLLVTTLEENGVFLSSYGNHASTVEMRDSLTQAPINLELYFTMKNERRLFNLEDVIFLMCKRADQLLELKRETNLKETSLDIAKAVAKCLCREVSQGDVIMALYLLGVPPIFDKLNGESFTARYAAKLRPDVKKRSKSSCTTGFPEIP